MLDDRDEIERQHGKATLHEGLAVDFGCSRQQAAAILREQRLDQELAACIAQAKDLVKVCHVVHLKCVAYFERKI